MYDEEALLSLKPVVKAIAQSYFLKTPPSVTYDELEAAAWDGAMDFLPRYDPSKNVPLKSAAKQRIQGAIQDYLRKLDPLTRGQRKHGEFSFVSLDFMPVDGMGQKLQIPDRNVILTFLDIETADALKPLWRGAGIKGRNLRILRKFFFDGRTCEDLGRTYKVNQSRISQIVMNGVQKLRARAELLKKRTEEKCPCGHPLWYRYSNGRIKKRGKYCSRPCRNLYMVMQTCVHPGCSKPAWKRVEYNPNKKHQGGRLCKMHSKVKQAKSDKAYKDRCRAKRLAQAEEASAHRVLCDAHIQMHRKFIARAENRERRKIELAPIRKQRKMESNAKYWRQKQEKKKAAQKASTDSHLFSEQN